MKWARATFRGRKEDGTWIDYTGYTAESFGITRKGQRNTYYDVIHLPSGVSVVPRWLWLKKLVRAKAYAAAIRALRTEEGWRSTELNLTTAEGLVDIARQMDDEDAREAARLAEVLAQ